MLQADAAGLSGVETAAGGPGTRRHAVIKLARLLFFNLDAALSAQGGL